MQWLRTDKWFFWAGLTIVAGYILLTDVRILLHSAQPYLYGIQDTFETRFEESILYLPFFSNSSLWHFFKIDYYGASLEQGLAPYPYFAIAIFGLSYRLMGSDINWAVCLIHGLIIVEYILAYLFMRRLQTPRGVAALLGLGTVFYLYHFPLSILIGLALCALLSIVSSHRYLWGLLGILAASVFVLFGHRFVQIVPLSTTIFREFSLIQESLLSLYPLLTNSLLVSYINFDLYATRFISPVLPMVILLATVYAFLAVYQILQRNPLRWWHGVGLSLLIAANAYTYFVSILLITPMALLWLIQLRVQLLRQWKATLLYFLLAGALLVPFAITVVLSKTNLAHSEYLYRASLQGIQSYAHFDSLPIGGEYWLAALALLIIYGTISWRHRKIDFTLLVYPILYWSVTFCLVFNHYVPKIIPQPNSLTRFSIPTLIIALAPLFALAIQSSKTKWHGWLSHGILSVGIGLMASSVLFMAAGRFHAHHRYSGPANVQVVTDLAYLRPYLTSNDIIVSNHTQINLLAPGVLGVRTLRPNPIGTLGTHASLVAQYALETKLLGGDLQDYFNTIGDIDVMGEVHILTPGAPTGMYLFSQDHGLAYPLPSDWIHHQHELMVSIYESTDVSQQLQTIRPVYLYLIDQDIAVTVEPYFELIASDEHRKLYRQKADL